jgi:hypothetical protein
MTAYRPAEARAAYERIARADFELKTGQVPGAMGVSLLALGVCGTPSRASAAPSSVRR